MSSTAPGPVQGPCVAWIDGADVAACVAPETVGSDAAKFELAAIEASMLLFELSGRQYTGGCEQSVRPCQNGRCGAWGGAIAQGVNPLWWWGTWPIGSSTWGWWLGETGSQACGCNGLSRVKLSGYPVTEIVDVLIGGESLPEFDVDTGARNWRLDNWRWLTRMWAPNADQPSNPGPRYWPGCQNLGLDPDQPGTFAVTYRYGVAPPRAGFDAAVQLAYQLWLACNGGECALPEGVTEIDRLGVTISRSLFLSWGRTKTGGGDLVWSTGLSQVDAFLNAYNPSRQRRRSVVWSPDVQQFAKKLGS